MPSLSDAPVSAQNLTKDNVVDLIANKINAFVENYRAEKLSDNSLPLLAFQIKHLLLLWMAADSRSYKSDLLEKINHQNAEYHKFIGNLEKAVYTLQQFTTDMKKWASEDIELDETQISEIKTKLQEFDLFLNDFTTTINTDIDLTTKIKDLRQQMASLESPYEKLGKQGREFLYILAMDDSGKFVQHEELIQKLGEIMSPLIMLSVQMLMHGNVSTELDQTNTDHLSQAIELKENLHEAKRLLAKIQESSDKEQISNLLKELLANMSEPNEDEQVTPEPANDTFATKKVGKDGIVYEGFGNLSFQNVTPDAAKPKSRFRWL